MNICNSLSWLEISSSALKGNIQAIKASLKTGCQMVPVVKANAYGHGYLEIASLLDREKFVLIAVHNLEEALLLRTGEVKTSILILGYVPFSDLKTALEMGFDLTVYSKETIEKLSKLATKDHPAKCHLKLETGTNRQGINKADLPEILEYFKKNVHLHLIGVSSHFANIEDTTDHSYAELQLDRFLEMKKMVEAEGLTVPFYHIASSASSLLFQKTHFNLARVGIALYGLWPSKETYLSYKLEGKDNNILQPVMSWKTIVAQIKNIQRGEFIGYGTTYRATSDMKLAVLPIGYYDGYDRQLSNNGYVLINGLRAPIRGRICMDLFMVDITDIADVSLEDEVVLIGRSGDEILKVEQLAGWANTINYEIVARIGAHLERRIVE